MSRLIKIFAACVPAIWAASLFGSVCSAEEKPYRIGVILPLTGPGAAYGTYAKDGIELAIDQLAPEDKSRIQVKIEDDGLEPGRTVTAYQSLVNTGGVNAVIAWSSGSANAIVGRTEGSKIPMIGIASDPAVALGKKFAFTNWALPEDEVRALYDVLAKEQRKKIALASLTQSGVTALREAIQKLSAEDKRVEIVLDEEFPGDVKDFRPTINRLRALPELDAIIPTFFGGQLSAFVKQTRNLGIRAPFYGFETFEDKDEVKAAEGQLTGGIYSTGADPTPEFIQAFQTKYPGVTTYTACNSYDSINLLAEASRQTQDPAAVAEFLRTLKDYHGACGVFSASGDNRFRLPVTVRQVTNDGFVSYEPLPAVRMK